MNAIVLAILLGVSGCQLIFKLDATPGADAPGDATDPSRCAGAPVGDDLQGNGLLGPFWDPPQGSAMIMDDVLVLDALIGRRITSHRYFPIVEGESVTVEVPEVDLQEEGAFVGLRLRYDTTRSLFNADAESSIDFTIARVGNQLVLRKQATLNNSVVDDEADVPFDPALHRFLRITFDDDPVAPKMVLSAAPDGLDYARVYERPVLEDRTLEAVQIELIASGTNRAVFASVCSDLEPARPISELQESFVVQGSELPQSWRFVGRDCLNASVNGSAEMLFEFDSLTSNNCGIATKAAYDLRGGVVVADVIPSTGSQAGGTTVFAIELEDRSQLRFAYTNGDDQLRAQHISPEGVLTSAPQPTGLDPAPRFWHFHNDNDALRLDYQANVGPETSAELHTFPDVRASAVQIHLAIVGNAAAGETTSFLAVTNSQPTQ